MQFFYVFFCYFSWKHLLNV